MIDDRSTTRSDVSFQDPHDATLAGLLWLRSGVNGLKAMSLPIELAEAQGYPWIWITGSMGTVDHP